MEEIRNDIQSNCRPLQYQNIGVLGEVHYKNKLLVIFSHPPFNSLHATIIRPFVDFCKLCYYGIRGYFMNLENLGQNKLTKNLKIENSARESEILVACLLSNTIFKNQELIVGDGGNNSKKADITAKDNSFAIEVVSNELLQSRIESCCYFNITELSYEYQKNLEKKLSKLNKGNYQNSPQRIFLAVDSMQNLHNSILENRSRKKLNNEIAQKYATTFRDIIILDRCGILSNRKFKKYEFELKNFVLNVECELLIDLEKYE
ncbi:MAG: hypothetical protein LBP62_02190 [Clostridiales bacterium]|jgi:hypothetical protein|nr:hypothetical protein [Clostridiales bacterium]